LQFLKINTVKNFNAEKIVRTSTANSEHKHSKIERFLTLNNRIISYSITIVKT